MTPNILYNCQDPIRIMRDIIGVTFMTNAPCICALYLREELSYDEMVENLQNKIWQFAKRQILWNKRYK